MNIEQEKLITLPGSSFFWEKNIWHFTCACNYFEEYEEVILQTLISEVNAVKTNLRIFFNPTINPFLVSSLIKHP